MGLLNKTIDELIDIASQTTNLSEMLFLQKCPSMNVRRALARNHNIYEEVLNSLVYDSVENVSYMASRNPKSKIKRDFKNSRVCVTCEKPEKGLNCVDCSQIKPYC